MSLKRAAAWLVLLAVIHPAAHAQTCPAGTIPYTFTNQCAYDIWLGEYGTQPANTNCSPPAGQCGYLPTSGTWQINAGGNATVCIPQTWASGRFWARTGCTGSGSTLNCATGQCGGAGAGAADCTKAGMTEGNPANIFEVTTNAGSNGVSGNFDVSLVNGYTVPTWAAVTGSGCTRDRFGCQTNLLLNSCPAALQWTQSPISLAAGGSKALPCGGNTFCPSGQCVGGKTCLLGCFDPGDACLQQASSAAPLKCNIAIPGASGTNCSGSSISSVPYLAMYLAKNYGGQDKAGHTYSGDNIAQISANQGSPTCFGNDDCAASSPNCVTTGFPSTYQPPAGTGVCLNLANGGSSNSYVGQVAGGAASCSQSTSGKACGGPLPSGFSNALGYTCQPVTYTQTGGGSQTAYACLPSLAAGLGTCETSSTNSNTQNYAAAAGVTNPAWVTAGQQAGANGKAYYQIFKTACPTAYSYQYDDPSSLFSCNSVTAFAVTFCPHPILGKR